MIIVHNYSITSASLKVMQVFLSISEIPTISSLNAIFMMSSMILSNS